MTKRTRNRRNRRTRSNPTREQKAVVVDDFLFLRGNVQSPLLGLLSLIDTGVDLDTCPLTNHKLDHVQRSYTCRHFDGSNCLVYEERPQMCRNYPADFNGCGVDGCTYRKPPTELLASYSDTDLTTICVEIEQ